MSKALMTAAKLYNDQRFLSKSEIRIYNNKLRRRRIVRRQKFMLATVTAIILFLIIFITSTLMLDAQSDEYMPEFKYYKEITVHTGDSLWGIARENISYNNYKDLGSYIAEICSINNLHDGSALKAGESLIIPYYSTEYK